MGVYEDKEIDESPKNWLAGRQGKNERKIYKKKINVKGKGEVEENKGKRTRRRKEGDRIWPSLYIRWATSRCLIANLYCKLDI